MAHCIAEFDYLDKNIQDKIYDYIKNNSNDMKQSELYSSEKKKNLLILIKDHLNLKHLLIIIYSMM